MALDATFYLDASIEAYNQGFKDGYIQNDPYDWSDSYDYMQGWDDGFDAFIDDNL